MSRQDIDGNLEEAAASSGGSYVKRLPRSTAWRMHDPLDLADTAIANVDVASDPDHYLVHYDPDLVPLDLDQLRSLVRANDAMAIVRVLKLATDLYAHLVELQDLEIWQMVVHPQRVASLRDRFLLMPTMTPYELPPFAEVPSNDCGGWLDFVAPEVLRTRGTDESLLAGAEVYAVGRLILALCVESWEMVLADQTLALAEQRVESPNLDDVDGLPAHLGALRPVLGAATCHDYTQRAGAREMVARLTQLRDEIDPQKLFMERVTQGDTDGARACVEDLQKTEVARVFGDWSHVCLIMRAEMHLHEQPPKCPQARALAEQAEGPKEYRWDSQLLIARAYALETNREDHVKVTIDSFGRAMRLSGYRAEPVEAFTRFLGESYVDAEQVVNITSSVPVNRMPKSLVVLRTRRLMDRGMIVEAWVEIARSFEHRAYDPELFELADQVAQRFVSRHLLLEYSEGYANQEGWAAPLGLAYRYNAQEPRARQYLERAKAYRPKPEGEA